MPPPPVPLPVSCHVREHIHSRWVLIPTGSRLGDMRALTCRSDLLAAPSGGQSPPASSTCFLRASPDPGLVSEEDSPPRPPFPGPSAEAGAGQGLLPGACRGLITTPCPAGAPLERPAQAGGRGSVPPLQAPCCARARGPVRGLLGLGQVTFRRKVLGLGPLFLGPYSSRSLSLRPRNARG